LTGGPRSQALDRTAIRGIVFDLDGTLVDSYEPIAHSLNHARARLGQPPLDLEFVRSRVGRGLETLVAELLGAEHVDDGVRWFRERYEQVHQRTRILPGVRPTLRTLAARGYRMSVASNKPARFGEAILRRLGLRPFLIHVDGPDLAGTTKPDPAMIRRCLAATRVDPGHALYVGDMVLDVESARRAGLPVLLVSGGSSAPDELRATGEVVLERFGGLLEHLP